MSYFINRRRHITIGKYMVEVVRLVNWIADGQYPIYSGHRPLFDWHGRRPHPQMEPLPERRLHLFGYVWVFMLYMKAEDGSWEFYRKEGP